MYKFFNHEQFRRYLIAFGSIFSNMEIHRTDASDDPVQQLVVPIEYGPKERWLTRLTQDPDFLKGVSHTVPRFTYEVSGITYDASRKMNSLNTMQFPDSETQQLSRMWVGVPYTLTFDLTLLTKTQQDALQVVEQILPLFTPDYTFSLLVIPSFGLIDTIPVILNSVSNTDTYESEFEKHRVITWTFNFSMKVNFYGPTKSARNGGQIEEVIVNLYNTVIGGLGNRELVLGEDGQPLTTESNGAIVTEHTSNTFLTLGKVVTVDTVATPNQPKIPGPDVQATTTITEYAGDDD